MAVTDEITRHGTVRADRNGGREGSAVSGVWDDTRPWDTPSWCCSEHEMIGPKTTRQSNGCAMASFDTAQLTAVSCLIIIKVLFIILSTFLTFVPSESNICHLHLLIVCLFQKNICR